jgi:hypothetical protein
MQFGERIEKNNWDQPGPGPAALHQTGRTEENDASAAPPPKNAPVGFCGRFLGLRDLIWDDRQLRLHSIRGRVLAVIEPERQWLGMWRVRMADGHVTDMLNLSRAKDAAASLSLATLNRRQEAA